MRIVDLTAGLRILPIGGLAKNFYRVEACVSPAVMAGVIFRNDKNKRANEINRWLFLRISPVAVADFPCGFRRDYVRAAGDDLPRRVLSL